jgi:hypothetical protein
MGKDLVAKQGVVGTGRGAVGEEVVINLALDRVGIASVQNVGTKNRMWPDSAVSTGFVQNAGRAWCVSDL